MRRPCSWVSVGLPLALLVALFLQPAVARAGASPLDPSFGEGGTVITPAPSSNAWEGSVVSLAEDRAGRLIAAGSTYENYFALLRYQSDGSLDRSFKGGSLERDKAAGGLVETSFAAGATARDVAVQPDGKILAAGTGYASSAFAFARYEESGTRDPSFGNEGRLLTHLGEGEAGALALALQPNGRFIAGGYRESLDGKVEGLLIRYLPNGAVDTSFGAKGRVSFKAPRGSEAIVSDLALLPSGKILVAGELRGEFMLARLLPNGRRDPSFGHRGRVLTDVSGRCECAFADSLALSEGKIVLAGRAFDGHGRRYAALAPYLPNGRLDPGFGHRGIVRTHLERGLFAEDVVIDAAGRIVLAGYSWPATGEAEAEAAVLRYLPDGRLDPSFASSGVFTDQIGYASAAFAALVQPDGKVVIGGEAKLPPKPFSEIENPYENAPFVLLRFQ